MSSAKDVAIIGGAVSGLAAAEILSDLDTITSVHIFERQEYDEKAVNCGEAINDSTLVPLDKTPENGFVNDVDGFQLRVYDGVERDPMAEPLGVSNLVCEPGYICERDVVERKWAERLQEKGVEFTTGKSVTVQEYEEIVEAHDYVVDATGQPSITLKKRGRTRDYTGDMVALNATVQGDFSEYVRRPRIFFEGFVGYSWSFPKSESHANVGIGWAGESRPDNYIEEFQRVAERNGFPVPDRDQVNIYTIPRGPSLNPDYVQYLDENVFLVGDAAGIANRYQGEGICQGIRSAYLLGELISEGREEEYAKRLYDLMKPEYRLAHLMRGAWVEHEDPQLLAAVAEAIDGLSIEDITRRPSTVIRRVLRHPTTAIQLVSDKGMLTRFVDAYTDNWEYK